MPEILFSPIKLRFDGLDSDAHHMDAEMFGKSIAGTAKLYNTAAHLFYTGSVPSGRTVYKIKMHTNAEIKEGSICAAIYAVMVHGEMAVYPQLWGNLADVIIPDWVKAVYAKLTKRNNEIREIYEKHTQIMQEENQRQRDHTERVTQMAFTTILQSQDRFLQTIDAMADNSKGAARDSVEPIGRTSSRIEQRTNTTLVLQLDQPIADALRSKEELEVADETFYFGKILGADKTNGSCRVQLDDLGRTVAGKITDPALQTIGNVYTHSLDTDARVKIKAKATLKDGDIKTLYISDAEESDA